MAAKSREGYWDERASGRERERDVDVAINQPTNPINHAI